MAWMLFPGNPVASGIAIFLIALPFLWAARHPVHGLLRSLTRALSHPLRLVARWLAGAADAMRARNETVLLAEGREEVTETIEREFERVTAIVRRDLQGYPALQRRLLDEITQIEEDYQKCGEVPPPPPEWAKAVETIAKIKGTGDGLVQKILEDISESVDGIYEKVLGEYRKSYKDRHKILERFQPFWRSLEQTLTRVGKNLTGLDDSAAKIDGQMEKYELIVKRSDKVVQTLTASASKMFFVSTIGVVVAIGGAFINFFLIAHPMSAMVGGGEYIFGGMRASHVAALVILFIEATMGIFLMDTMRFTNLFPRIHNLNERMRTRLMWAAGIMLLVLAGVEVALAVMRDMLVAEQIALTRELAEVEAGPATGGWVAMMPLWAQMVLGFVLPFALAFLAIPLETFVSSGRTVLGVLVVAAVRTVSLSMRLLANLVRHTANALTLLYDAVIFLPVLIERAVRGRHGSAAGSTAAGAGKGRNQDDWRKAG
jgi:hypothetical protein